MRWVRHCLVSHTETDLVAPEVDMEEDMVGREQVPDKAPDMDDKEGSQEAVFGEDNLEGASLGIPGQEEAALEDSQVH